VDTGDAEAHEALEDGAAADAVLERPPRRRRGVLLDRVLAARVVLPRRTAFFSRRPQSCLRV
jgi:hypothetical protein